MVDSPRYPYPQNVERSQTNSPQEQNNNPHQRLCDFCGESKALLYCRADSAKLCFHCDREVHSTNPLFTKHTRSQLCDFCDSNPASILCLTDNLVLCQNCDWDSHGRSSSSSIHDRRSLDGFIGCPSGVEFCSILGIEDVGDKCLMNGSCGDDYLVDDPSLGVDGFEDLLSWDTQTIFSIDDVVGSTDSNQNFQATRVPPLPKNRNTTCGKYTEEILHQLGDMVKLENCFINDQEDLTCQSNDHDDLESLLGFQPLVPELTLQTGAVDSCFKSQAKPITLPLYEENKNKNNWEKNPCEAPLQVSFQSAYIGSYTEQNSVVPDKSTEFNAGADANLDLNNQSPCPVIVETPRALPKLVLHKSVTQNRDSSLSRYKEKKKTRRYDHHIRYESRKARAESRSRIRGRFAKIEN